MGWKNFPRPKETTDDDDPLSGKKSKDSDSSKPSFKTNKNKGPLTLLNSESNSEDDNGPSDNESLWPFSIYKTVLTLGGILALFYWLYHVSKESCIEIYYQQFLRDLALLGLVDKLEVVNNEKVRVYLRGRNLGVMSPDYFFYIPSVENFEQRIEELINSGVLPMSITYKREINYFNGALGYVSPVMWISFTIWLLYAMKIQIMKIGKVGGPGGIFSIGKSRAKRFKKGKSDVTFKDVAGCNEAKVEIQEFVSFLKNPKKYQDLGAKLPKGALLVGPPGTGKTLLSRATAGEANVPFYSVAGSDFLEMFVGVGASRVRDLFKEARENAPSIIFIDEIDAIGRKRGNRVNSSNDERESTLNQLLTEMDGFNMSKNPVLIMAGTNRPDVLDKALLRPGRFDRTIALDSPDIGARKEILLVHLVRLTLEHKPEYYAGRLAAMTPGFSGADLANVCNEAALIAARGDAQFVTYAHFEAAIERIVAGLERKTTFLCENDKRVVAFHEAGHATVSWFLEHGSPLLKVSIIPRGKGLGYAMYIPEEYNIYTENSLMDMMAVTLGGRAAEEIVFDSITTGAQDDLQKVTQMAYGQVLQYGMSKFGPVSFGSIKDEGYISKSFSEETASQIDEEVRQLVDNAYERAKSIVSKHRELFNKLGETLFEKEVLSYEDCCQILGERPFKPGVKHQAYMQMSANDKLDRRSDNAFQTPSVDSP